MAKVLLSSWTSVALVAIASTAVTVACGGSSGGGSSSDSSSASPSGSGAGSSGSSGSSGSGGDACAATTRALCTKACACTSNGTGKCRISYGAASETHDSQDKCETFYSFMVCGDAKYAAQYDSACGAAIEAASCTTTTEGPALAFPTAGCPKK